MTVRPSVAGLVLAAGEGRRFGGPKALAELDGERLVDRALRVLAEGGCAPLVVVLGARAAEVRAAARLVGADVVVADGWAEGMGASLRAGLAALAATPADAVGAVVVALADQPRVGADAVARLRAAWGEGRVTGAAVATYAGERRNPVLLDRRVWDAVSSLARGDAGARPWLSTHPESVLPVPCDGTGTWYDVDTREDLATLLEESA